MFYRSYLSPIVSHYLSYSQARLAHEADRIELELELDPQGALECGRDAGLQIAQRTCHKDYPGMTMDIWTKLFGSYKNFAADPETAARSKMYFKHNDSGPYHANSAFQATNRIKLVP